MLCSRDEYLKKQIVADIG